MKKVVSLALSTLLVLSLAACGKADSSAAASSESKSSASSNSTSNSAQDYSPDGIKVGETYTTEDGKTYERGGTAQAAIYLRRPPNPKLHTIMISRHKHLLIMKNAPLSCRA